MWLASATSGRSSTARVSVSGSVLPLALPIHDPDGKPFDVVADGAEVVAFLVEADGLQLTGLADEFNHVVVHGVGDGFNLPLAVGHG